MTADITITMNPATDAKGDVGQTVTIVAAISGNATAVSDYQFYGSLHSDGSVANWTLAGTGNKGSATAAPSMTYTFTAGDLANGAIMYVGCSGTDTAGTSFTATYRKYSLASALSIVITPTNAASTIITNSESQVLSVVKAGGQTAWTYVWNVDGSNVGSTNAAVFTLNAATYLSAAGNHAVFCYITDGASNTVTSDTVTVQVKSFYQSIAGADGYLAILSTINTYLAHIAAAC